MKKNQMTEVLVLALLGVILIAFAGYNYLIKPLNEKTATLEQQVQTKETNLRVLNAATLSYDANLEKLKGYANGLEECKKYFFSNEKQEVYLEHFNTNMREHYMTLSSLNSNESELRPAAVCSSSGAANRIRTALAKDPLLTDDKNVVDVVGFNTYYNKLTESKGKMESNIYMTSFSLALSGRFDNVMNFLDGMLDHDKNIIINNLTLDITDNEILSAEDNPFVTAQVEVLFLMVPAIDSICSVEVPEPLPPYVFPIDIESGSYKRSSGFLAGLLDMFG